MNAEMETIAGIRLVIYVLIGWIIYFWGYRKLRIDLLRHKLFVLRDSLFIKTHSMGVPLDSPSYVTMRQTLNGLLRYGHRVSIWGVLAAYWGLRKDPREERPFSDDLDDQLAALHNEEYRKFVQDIYQRMMRSVFWHITTGAPILILYVAYKLCSLLVQALYYRSRRAIHLSIQSLSQYIASDAPGSNTVPLVARTWERTSALTTQHQQSGNV